MLLYLMLTSRTVIGVALFHCVLGEIPLLGFLWLSTYEAAQHAQEFALEVGDFLAVSQLYI